MDLGIRGRSAIVCASSRGLGLACATALAAEGVRLVMNGRDADRLAAAAAEVRKAHDVAVTEVVGDVTTAEVRQRLLSACPEADILVTNSNGPNPGEFTEFTASDWMAAMEANMVSHLMLVSALVPGMRSRRFGRIVNITSAMVTTPRPTMGLSSAARAGLTAALKGLAIEVAKDNVTINNVLPERIDTDRQRFMAARVMERESITYDVARTRQEASVAAGRLGAPEEFGVVCAFLCGALAGFVSGNNVHVDGGTYPAMI